MANQILVPHGGHKKIKERFDTSFPTVRRALAGADDTDLARKIRGYATSQCGGVEVKQD